MPLDLRTAWNWKYYKEGENLNLAQYIDHTILKPDTTISAIEKVCEEARTHHFYSVCINPHYVSTVKQLLDGSDVKITSVIGFPLGAHKTATKVFETVEALKDGADEIDMVINVAALKNKDYALVLSDIQGVRAVIPKPKVLKVIIETCLLTDEEKIKACELSVQADADYVKTSTGFSTDGATLEDIKLMRKVVGPELGVKASGGIRSKAQVLELIEAGATRIGASSSVQIVLDQTVDSKGY